MKLDYSPQVNQMLQPYLQKLDPQLQQLVKSMTPQQISNTINQNPELLQQLTQQTQQTQSEQAKPLEANTQRFLDKLQEEASEVIQAVSKIRRFGPDNHHPDREQTNKQELISELEDFLALVAVLEASGYLDLTQSKDQITQKAEALLK